MKTWFRVLTVLHGLLTCAALALGILLFEKRELLKGRTWKLEQAVMQLATTIEKTESPLPAEKPSFPARDIDSLSAQPVERPETSSFWTTYRHELENTQIPTVDLSTRTTQLATFYRIDPITLEPMRDPQTGQKLTSGPDTMQELLDELVSQALTQHTRLDETRDQLRVVREELVNTVVDLNSRKQDLRAALGEVVQRESVIAGLRNQIGERDETLRECREEITGLHDELGEAKATLAQSQERVNILVADLDKLKNEIATLKNMKPEVASKWEWMRPGVKGRVVDVNDSWNYAILEVTADFVQEYAHASQQLEGKPEVDLCLCRPDTDKSSYIAKVRVDRFYPEKRLAAVTPLPGLQYAKVRKGDNALY